VIGVVLDKGVKRLTDQEIVKSGASTVQHIHRTSTRGMRQQIQVDFEKLDREQQKEFNTTLSTLQLTRLMTDARSQQKIAGAVEKQQTRLDSEKMLKLFGTKSKGAITLCQPWQKPPA
jgi:inorganic triphosphatase YgiF